MFGCSYTEYMWPTWASIIMASEQKYGREAYNFGQCGVSNNAIMNNICIADRIFNFTDRDRIMVVWTSLHRRDVLESYWCDGDKRTYWQWRGDGNIFGGDITERPSWIQHYVVQDWSLELDLINNFSTMNITDRAYNLAFQGHIYEPLETGDIKHLGLDEGICAWYNSYYAKNGKHLFNQRTSELWHGAPGMVDAIQDPHPDPAGHLQYVKDCVLPQTGMQLHPDVEQNTQNYQRDMERDLGHMSHSELQSMEGEYDGQRMSVLNAKCLELADRYGFVRGSSTKNYVWLFKQITPSTILNKII